MKKTRGFLLAAGVMLALAFTISCEASVPSAFVGKWIRINGLESMELFKDGTGVFKHKERSLSIQWKVMDKRFVLTAASSSEAVDYGMSGNKLTLTNDKGEKKIYVKTQQLKPQAGKVEGPALADNRDGKKYKTVKIGTQTWMAENLNYEAEGSGCYGDDGSYCQKYGRLYNWNAALKACPSGWHLPSDKEWQELVDFAGGGGEDNTAGAVLKSADGWGGDGNGTDYFGFSALPGGYGGSNGVFINVGYYGYWWSSSEYGSHGAYYRYMDYNYEYVGRNYLGKSGYISVRCLRD